MSPNVGNFVHDLVEMAKAMEDLPNVKRELENALKANADLLDVVQQKELRIIDLKNESDDKTSRIRALEVARDDAELRFLEADERTQRALDFIKATFGNAGSLIQALEPVKVQPVAEEIPSFIEPKETIPSWATPEVDHTGDYIPKPEPTLGDHAMPYAETGQSEANPTSTGSTAATTDAPVDTLQSNAPPTEASASTGQSEPLPTAASPIGESPAPIQPASGDVDSQQQHKPYFGKLYYDHPVWVSLEEWLAGGGIEADYTWRPAQNPRQAF